MADYELIQALNRISEHLDELVNSQRRMTEATEAVSEQLANFNGDDAPLSVLADVAVGRPITIPDDTMIMSTGDAIIAMQQAEEGEGPFANKNDPNAEPDCNHAFDAKGKCLNCGWIPPAEYWPVNDEGDADGGE